MKVKVEFTLGSDIVYIPVKVPVCQTCGERYYDRRTMQLLGEKQEDSGKTKRNR